MDERYVLQHLFEVEDKAGTFVDEAQASADAKVAEAEKAARSTYEADYARRSNQLEAEYHRALKKVQDDYAKLLESYKKELNDFPVDRTGFSALAESYLFGDK